MSEVTPGTGELARRLLRQEAASWEPLALADALDRLYDRLRQRLVGLVGQAGFAALCTRALHLARLAYPGLTAIEYDAAAMPCLRGTRDFALAHAPDAVGAALTDVLAQFIGLLDTFIGEALTMRLLDELWGDGAPEHISIADPPMERSRDEVHQQGEGEGAAKSRSGGTDSMGTEVGR